MPTITPPTLAGIEDLVPEVYAHYRPVVVDSLRFFFDNLPPHRRAAAIAGQLALGVEASATRRLMAFVHESATLHKLGQVLARNRHLDAGFRAELQLLESMEPRTETAAVMAALATELSACGAGELEISGKPLAEASVAVVVACTWHEAGHGPRDGVLKILKPGIEGRLAEDFEVWSRLGEYLDERIVYYALPRLEYRETFDQVRDLLAAEVELGREQEHLREAGVVYGSLPGVSVPRVWPMCTARLTAMSRLGGRKVTEVSELSAGQRRGLAERLIATLIVHPVLHSASSSLFHADAHAGNVLVDDAGTLGLLDWSLAGRLSKAAREGLACVVLGGVMMDAGKIAGGVAGVARCAADGSALRGVAEAALGRIAQGQWPALRWLAGLLDEAVRCAGARFDDDLMMFRKSLLLVEGAAADISAECDSDAVFLGRVVAHFASEWPARAMAGVFSGSRAFGTHVSNAELLELMWRGPAAAAGYWRRAFGG